MEMPTVTAMKHHHAPCEVAKMSDAGENVTQQLTQTLPVGVNNGRATLEDRLELYLL